MLKNSSAWHVCKNCQKSLIFANIEIHYTEFERSQKRRGKFDFFDNFQTLFCVDLREALFSHASGTVFQIHFCTSSSSSSSSFPRLSSSSSSISSLIVKLTSETVTSSAGSISISSVAILVRLTFPVSSKPLLI